MQIIKWDGLPISKPGVYSGVDISVYHSGKLCVGPSISSSGLRTIFGESEAHYWNNSPLNPYREPPKESEVFVLGRACHHLLLGEPHFAKTFIVRPDEAPDGRAWSGNNSSCKKWLAEQKEAGHTVLTGELIERIKGMALALGKEGLVRAGALNGLIETTLAWIDEETGVWLIARPDVIPTDSGDYVDLKSTTAVDYASLIKTIGTYSYHQQGALIGEGHRLLFGRAISSFSLYFCESKRPHCCRMVTLKNEDIALGERQNRNAIRRFVKAMNSGSWPGPGGNQEAVQFVEISDRQRKLIEDRLRVEGE